jgi:ABC-type dipeptide/oligopeptide/nickel transport system permease component
MQRYILGRIIQSVVCVLVVATIVFIIVRLTGNPLDVLTDERAAVEDRKMVAENWDWINPFLFNSNPPC